MNDDKIWNAAIATIESLRFQLMNSAGEPADERRILRINLRSALHELARYVDSEEGKR
jgi:hypothetical protein